MKDHEMTKYFSVRMRVSILNAVKDTAKAEGIFIGKFIGDAICYFRDIILPRLTPIDIWSINRGLEDQLKVFVDEVEYKVRIPKVAWDIANNDATFKKRFWTNVACALYLEHLTKTPNNLSKFVDDVLYMNVVQSGEIKYVKEGYEEI